MCRGEEEAPSQIAYIAVVFLFARAVQPVPPVVLHGGRDCPVLADVDVQVGHLRAAEKPHCAPTWKLFSLSNEVRRIDHNSGLGRTGEA